jgi:hypothetical protein
MTAIRTFVGRSLVVNVLYLIYAIANCEHLAQALDLPQLLKMRFIKSQEADVLVVGVTTAAFLSWTAYAIRTHRCPCRN